MPRAMRRPARLRGRRPRGLPAPGARAWSRPRRPRRRPLRRTQEAAVNTATRATIPASVKRSIPPEKKICGQTSFRSTKSVGGGQFLLQHSRAKALIQGMDLFPRHQSNGLPHCAPCCKNLRPNFQHVKPGNTSESPLAVFYTVRTRIQSSRI